MESEHHVVSSIEVQVAVRSSNGIIGSCLRIIIYASSAKSRYVFFA